MDSSRLSFKLFAPDSLKIEPHLLVPLFHSWIQTHALKDHLLVDVADYSHVHNGPGIVLVSQEANISIDQRGGRLGMTYHRKWPMEVALVDRMLTVFGSTLQAAGLLDDRLKFRKDEIEFRVCDRLLAPNTEATLAKIKSELLKIWPGAKLTCQPSPQGLFTVTINPAQPIKIPTAPS